MKKYLDDILIFLGCDWILAGIYILVGLSWTLIAGGLMLIGAGILVALSQGSTKGAAK